ncbi:hypothetical protein [Dyella sp.]|uniref:FliH/SctL family protein n=1 Tax=Dyella sp. TaxID=1869338 RepID=UPI002FDA2B2B
MSRLLKASAVTLTREHRTALPRQADAAPAVVNESDTALEKLREQIAALQAQIENLQQEAKHKEATAYERGIKEGQQKAEESIQRKHDKQIEVLTQAVQEASAQFNQTLDALLPLSLDIAEAALSRIIEQPSRYAELIVQTIERQLRNLSSDAVLAIDVSAEDFPAGSAFESELQAIGSRHGLAITIKPSATAGTCLLQLALGRIDADLSLQRERLAETFMELRRHDG